MTGEAPPPGARCADCGAGTAPGMIHCPACGAVAAPARLALRPILAGGVEHLLSLDPPLLRTLVDLCRFPGRVCAEYADGRRRRYASPLKYNLVAAAILIAVIRLVVRADGPAPGLLPEAARLPAAVREASELAMAWHNDWLQVVYLLALPLQAWLLRLVLGRRSGRTTMEFYAMCLYAYGHIYLLQAAFNGLAHSAGDGAAAEACRWAAGLAPFLYFPWATVGFCPATPIRSLAWSLVTLVLFAMAVSAALMGAALLRVALRG